MSTWKFSIWKTSISLKDNNPNTNKLSSLKMVNIYNNWGLGDQSREYQRKKENSFLYLLARWLMVGSPYSSNSWCELSMIDDGETGQFTNCYWEYLSYLHTNNPGPRQTRYLYFQQKLSPSWKVLQSGWWSEGGRDTEKIKDVFMQKTKSRISQTICCFIFC